jgi:excisionase family DNA binding protein
MSSARQQRQQILRPKPDPANAASVKSTTNSEMDVGGLPRPIHQLVDEIPVGVVARGGTTRSRVAPTNAQAIIQSNDAAPRGPQPVASDATCSRSPLDASRKSPTPKRNHQGDCIVKKPKTQISPLLSVKEVAEIMGAHPRTVRRLIKSRQLRAQKLGGLLRVPEDALVEFQRLRWV